MNVTFTPPLGTGKKRRPILLSSPVTSVSFTIGVAVMVYSADLYVKSAQLPLFRQSHAKALITCFLKGKSRNNESNNLRPPLQVAFFFDSVNWINGSPQWTIFATSF